MTKKNSCRTDHHRHSKVLLKAIVIGAGIGGLATAVALRRRGHDVTVLEQADKLAEVGAGIQVPPNSSRQDSRAICGLRQRFADVGFQDLA